MSIIHPLESQEAPVPLALRPPSSVLSPQPSAFHFSNSEIRIPNSEFRWWRMLNAWHARWKRNSTQRSLIQALEQP